ncbi:rRNA maturation RNase YbeY [Muriicola marianensis]|uniref:Endoribonuclease YbeY n=1 Tax=Muriicola marianensis TaxID=1324801 RepID=A0ABQ1QYM5_9FLAO|nr:rRNA maturation RNase YbeY [Muriicola marianensis]GGD50112.1 endoribonuclease YbeY [Muriicola marianensis]
MIDYTSNSEFVLKDPDKYTDWLIAVIKEEGFELGEISYVFTSDEELLEINKEYLDHDYYTDIITFDYTSAKVLSGDIFISTDRVKDNAGEYNVTFDEELRRVMIHGVLHLMGFNDKSEEEKKKMTFKEDSKLKMFHVEQ